MQRGEVWWVSFAGGSGGEVRKTRPAIIVSNNAANQHANRVQVVPLSSKTDKLYPCSNQTFDTDILLVANLTYEDTYRRP